MKNQVLTIAFLGFGANVFGIGYLSSLSVSFDVVLAIVLATSSVLAAAIVILVLWALTKDKKKKKKGVDRETEERFSQQSLVVPFRMGRVCMVSSSDGDRWVFPKGSVKKGETHAEAAYRELWEEAGLSGTIEGICGSDFTKKDKQFLLVFKASVSAEATEWPESQKRQRCWLSPAEASLHLSPKDVLLRNVLLAMNDAHIDRGATAHNLDLTQSLLSEQQQS